MVDLQSRHMRMSRVVVVPGRGGFSVVVVAVKTRHVNRSPLTDKGGRKRTYDAQHPARPPSNRPSRDPHKQPFHISDNDVS